MGNENSTQKERKSKNIWIVLAVAAFLLAIFFLANIFQDFRRHGFFGPPNSRNLHKRMDLSEIRGWMTFDFINKAFVLPPDYLKSELGITDKKYPNITVDGWAKNNQESSSALLDKIKKIIQNFPNPSSPKNPADI